MGHRANFVVIRDGQAKAYYDHWAALGCIHDLAAGPARACDAIAQFEPTTELMDWAFAEGGYLIDFDEKTAIGFGYPVDLYEFAETDDDADELIPDSNPPFEPGGLAFLQQIGPTWVGWKLVWDERGVDAFAAHLRRRSIADIACQPDSHPPDTSEAVEYQA